MQSERFNMLKRASRIPGFQDGIDALCPTDSSPK